MPRLPPLMNTVRPARSPPLMGGEPTRSLSVSVRWSARLDRPSGSLPDGSLTMRRGCISMLVLAAAMIATAAPAGAQVGFTTPSYVDTELAGGEPLALTDSAHGTIVYSSHEGTTHLYRPGFTSLAPVLLQYRNQVNIWYSPDDGASWNRVAVPGGFATPPAQNSGFSD